MAKTFASNIIIDLSYNWSKYIQFEVFDNCFKCVVYINTLFSPCYLRFINSDVVKYIQILTSCNTVIVLRNIFLLLLIAWVGMESFSNFGAS